MNILIAGQAKTGTTGLLHLISSSIGREHTIIFEPRECPSKAKQAHSNFIAKVIIKADVNLASFSHFDKKVVIFRDPRDRLISDLLYSEFHASYLLDEVRVRAVRECLEEKERRPSAISIREVVEVMGAAADKLDAVSLRLQGLEGSLKLFDAYIASIADHLLYKYEDFVSGNYAALEGYLGCEMTGKAEVPAALGRVVRTKSYGDWRNWFTKEDVIKFKPILAAWLKKYGYDSDDWTLNVVPSIEPEHCSGYFMRLVEEQRGKKTNTAKINVPAKILSASGTKMPNGKVVRDLLGNEGVLALNKPHSALPEKTVVVLGVARGGTTMVASVLQALGVFMGDKLGPVLEDPTLSRLVEAHNVQQLKELVASRNAAYSLWGWKRPSALDHSEVWKGIFRNPYIIGIFRDPFVIANRNRISMLSEVFQSMEQSVQQLGLLVKFLREQECPVLLCSYEKVLSSPQTFVRAVDNFLDLNATDRWGDAIRQVDPASQEYLEASRITQSLGHLDLVDERFCSGWVFYPKQPAKAADVNVFVNDQLIHTVTAKLPRSDVKGKGIHPTGLCGFRFEWPIGFRPQVGDIVAARAEGDIKSLEGSPKQVCVDGSEFAPNDSSGVKNRSGADAEPRGALPSFYCIGAQKAGTTWLHRMLKEHPQIYLPQVKEVHYWDLHSSRSLEWYRNHFVAGRINGDITPAYAILPEVKVAEIHTLTPQAKLLFSMRHPIDRAWSFVQMVVENEFQVCPDDLKAGEPKGEVLAFVRKQLFHPGCLARSNYAETIRRWRKQFSEDSLMWYRYERISEDPRGLLADVCRHIGADPSWCEQLAPDMIERTVFASKKIPFPTELRAEFADRFAPYIDDLEQLLGERFDGWRS